MNNDQKANKKKHPEDEIYRVKQFINELSKVQERYFIELVEELQLNDEGENWLFDYIYNSGEEGTIFTFEEYLEDYNKTFTKLLKDYK